MSHTITVKFDESVSPVTALDVLRAACVRIERAAVVERAAVEQLFPDTHDPKLETLFTIEVEGSLTKADDAAGRIASLDGVEYAQRDPERHPI